jgi:hypothetical protein
MVSKALALTAFIGSAAAYMPSMVNLVLNDNLFKVI